MTKKIIILIIFYSCNIFTRSSGPFQPTELDKEFTGPFKHEMSESDPQEYLADFVYPFEMDENEDEKPLIQVNLEDTSLAEIASFIEETFNINFIYEDTVNTTGTATTTSALEAIKLNFKTNRSMTRKELWDLFITFTDIAGKMISPGPQPATYLVSNTMPTNGGIRTPLPTYIGTNSAELPDNDIKIRYLYFVQNSSLATIIGIINAIKSAGAANIEKFDEVNGLLITEKASNIKAMMTIIKEIDRAAMPEAMSIIKLKRADATTVAKLYNDLIGSGPATTYGRPRKPPTGSYFPPNMKVIAEPRTNTLILLGTPESIKKIEDFIKEYVDTELDKPYSPLHTYYLKYADATTVAGYLNDLVSKQSEIDKIASQYGSVRDGDKLLGPMSFVAEAKTNMILILGDYDDYLKIHDLIEQIDVEQPQVILRVMLLTVDLADAKNLGVQLRSKVNDCDPGTSPNPSLRDTLGKNTTWQTSGVGPIIQNTTDFGPTRLLGDLIQLAVGQVTGTTAVTLGQDAFGIWGFLRVLDAHTKVNIVDTPFLIATNKTKAQIISGETRRVAEAQVTGGSNVSQTSLTDVAANLEVSVTPLISSDGLVTLEIEIKDEDFTGGSSDISRGNRVSRVINTETALFDKEVLAIGGIVRSRTEDSYQKVPILGDIPVLGWLFKNKTQTITKNSLIILISPEIVKTYNDEPMNDFTAERLADIEETFCQLDHLYQQRDPAHRWFFNDTTINEHAMIDAFLPGEPSTFSQEGKSVAQKTAERRAEIRAQAERDYQQTLVEQETATTAPVSADPASADIEEDQPIADQSIDEESPNEASTNELMVNEPPIEALAIEPEPIINENIKKRSQRNLREIIGGDIND